MPELCPCRRGFMAGLASLACVGTAMAQERRATTSPVPGSDGRNLCPEPPPRVAVRVVPVTPSFDDNVSSFDMLRTMNEGRGAEGAVTQHGQRPAGLTVVRFRTDTTLQIAGRSRPDTRQACVGPSAIEVAVTMDTHRIYVARDLTQPRTCQREVVIEHENRHARINFDCLDDARAAIHAALLRQLPTLGWLEGRNLDANAANAEFLQKVRPVVCEHLAAAVGRARARHAAMDSNEAYRRDWGRCG
ncbi:MAG: hypothetical protein ACKO1J_17210 [Tagaea sp.]